MRAGRCVAFVAVGFLGTLTSPGAPSPALAQPRTSPKLRAVEGYGRLPLHFEANQGQAAAPVEFLTRGSGYGLFLTATESVLVLQKTATKGSTTPPAVVRMRMLGANPRPTVTGHQKLPGKSNYFVGNDPTKWRTDITQYARVEYEDVYPGVSLAYYGHEGQLEYDFLVSPGAVPGRIRFGIEGAERIRVDDKGDLVLSLPDGEVVQRAPVVYQEIDGARKAVEGRFVIKGHDEVGFEVGPYETDRPLVLDPLLVYSTYLGGTVDDGGGGIAVDASGNAYVAGYTNSADFPTHGPFQGTRHGGSDAFVAKLSADGSALVYSTYFGGNGVESAAVAVDASGNAYLAGSTSSTDFPTVGAIQATFGGGHGDPFWNTPPTDAFVTKLSASGSALVYSTYLGGSGNEGATVAVDAAGNACVAGGTDSPNFPTVNALQPSLRGTNDAFVAKLSANGSALVYSTYLGGNGTEGATLAVDAAGNAYVAGSTTSTDFPTANPIQATFGGGQDAFVTKLSANGAALVYSTYLGGSAYEYAGGIAVDAAGDAYVTGPTFSTDFPTANPLQATSGGGEDAFVAKVNPAGSALLYSTYLGGSGTDRTQGIGIDAAGDAYVVGYNYSGPFPIVGSLQATTAGAVDTIVAKLSPSGSALVYSTYLGGASDDYGLAIAVDAAGNAYITGRSYFGHFPTSNALQPARGGGQDAFVAKIGTGTPSPGDFNADGKPDILWRNPATGDTVFWYMNGTALTTWDFVVQVPDTNWQVVGSAPIDADVRPDLIWRHRVTGQDAAWFMNGIDERDSAWLPTVADLNWQPVATGDFDADGKVDVVWRNQVSGQDVVWLMNGSALKDVVYLMPVADAHWTIAGAGDFNADGKPDILWRHQGTGDNVVWFMDGINVTGGKVLMQVADVNWVVGAVADYNADGTADIVWRHRLTGDNLMWLMNPDGTIAGGTVLTRVPDTNWRIAGPR